MINEGYDEYQTIFDGGKVDRIRRDRAVPRYADTRFAAGLNNGYEIRNGYIYEVKDNIFFGKVVPVTSVIHPTTSDSSITSSFGRIVMAYVSARDSCDDAYVISGRLYTRNSGGTSSISGCSVYSNHYTNSDNNWRGIPGRDVGQWRNDEGYHGHKYMRSTLKVISGYICNLDGSNYSGIDVFI